MDSDEQQDDQEMIDTETTGEVSSIVLDKMMRVFDSIEDLGYASTEIKKLGFSPDAFVQMSIQYAYRKMSGHFGATYESV